MKLIQNLHPEDPALNKMYIERGDQEKVLWRDFLFLRNIESGGELFIPEGIEEIEEGALHYCGRHHTIHFPKTLRKLSPNLFAESFSSRRMRPLTIIYPGSSERFMELAAPVKEDQYVTDGFDRSPYYSGGSRRITECHTFDEWVGEIRVECEEDGVTLLYGSDHRKNGEPPKRLEV